MEKRKYNRYRCKIKAKFNYYVGDPDEIDYDITVPSNGTGTICDISQGGIFIISRERVTVGMPAQIFFKIKKNKHSVLGKIIRTGLLKNNPSEVAQMFARLNASGDSYIVIEFKEPIQLSQSEL